MSDKYWPQDQDHILIINAYAYAVWVIHIDLKTKTTYWPQDHPTQTKTTYWPQDKNIHKKQEKILLVVMTQPAWLREGRQLKRN
jgi:hypothetical protein